MAPLLQQRMNFVQALPGRLISDLENGQRRQAHCMSRRYNQCSAKNGTLHFVRMESNLFRELVRTSFLAG